MATSETRWLSTEELETWVTFIRVAIKLPGFIDAQLQREAGLSHFDYYVLAALSEAADRTLRMSLLATRADVSLSHLSRVVARLERRDLITRRPDPDDGRSTLASLTDNGFDTLSAAAPGHVSAVRHVLFDAMTAEQARQLGDLCAVLQHNLLPLADGLTGEA